MHELAHLPVSVLQSRSWNYIFPNQLELFTSTKKNQESLITWCDIKWIFFLGRVANKPPANTWAFLWCSILSMTSEINNIEMNGCEWNVCSEIDWFCLCTGPEAEIQTIPTRQIHYTKKEFLQNIKRNKIMSRTCASEDKQYCNVFTAS